MDKASELNAELRKARGWLIAVGVIMFVVDMIYVHAVYGDDLPGELKTRLTMVSAAILCVFLALAWFTPRAPRMCLILGLVVFWGIHLYNAIDDPKSLFQGFILKILFTLALIRGLKNASRAEDIRKHLAEVFE